MWTEQVTQDDDDYGACDEDDKQKIANLHLSIADPAYVGVVVVCSSSCDDNNADDYMDKGIIIETCFLLDDAFEIVR